jgi:MarR family 2-MHQ and catechol resistance regulon transcriptional repressor
MDAALHDERLALAGLFSEAYAGLARALERGLESECGLSAQWFEVMLRLARSPEHRLRMQDLVAQVTLTPSGLTRVVDRLEGAGFVRRESCASDRRGAFAVLTDEGRRRIDEAVPVHLDHLEESLIRVLTTTDRDALEVALRKLRDALHPHAEAPRAQGSRASVVAAEEV